MKVILCSDNFRLVENAGKYKVDTSLYAYSLGIDVLLKDDTGKLEVESKVGAKRTALKVKELSNYIDTLTELERFIVDCNRYFESSNEK